MLSNNKTSDLIIWNIDYQNNRLIKNKVVPFTADILLRGNPCFGYIYIISKNQVKIIDENYKSIYSHNTFGYYGCVRNYSQMNTYRIFILRRWGLYFKKTKRRGDILIY